MNMVVMLVDLGHFVFEVYFGRVALEILWREYFVELVITD